MPSTTRTGYDYENDPLYQILFGGHDDDDDQSPEEQEITNAVYRRAMNENSAGAGMEILRSEVPKDWRRDRRNMESFMANEHGHSKDALPVCESWIEERLAIEEGDDDGVDFEYDILKDLWLADHGKNSDGKTMPHYNVKSRQESLRSYVESLSTDKESAVRGFVDDTEQSCQIGWKKCDDTRVVHVCDWKGDEMRVIERLARRDFDDGIVD